MAVPLALVVLVVGGTWAYINLVREDAPERLTVDQPDGGQPDGGQPDDGQPTGSIPPTLDGRWVVSDGSQAGYRVKEILFGQRAEGVGRTRSVTGEALVRGGSVVSASFTVQLRDVTSDERRRDGQFRGRIMDVATHPTASFKLAEPVPLQGFQPGAGQARVTGTGDLTLRGTTKRVTVNLDLKAVDDTIQASGAVPIVFAEWGIPNPSFGPAETEDRGELEFLLVFRPAA